MKIVGFNFKKITIERKGNSSKNLNINLNAEVKNIEKKTADIFKDQDTLMFDYEFKVDYEPNFANLLMEGTIFTLIEDNEISKKILKDWKDKKISEDVKTEVINAIFAKCNLRSLQLEEDLNLPPHIPLPRIVKP